MGPLLFIIYINDLVEACNNGSTIFLYADDAKIFKHILTETDKIALQKDLDSACTWTERWLLKLNVNKCKFVSYGRNYDYQANYTLHDTNLERLENFKDLGVLFDSKLKFGEHIQEK